MAELRPGLLGVEGQGLLRTLHLVAGMATVVVEPRSGCVEVTWRATGHALEADVTLEQALANVRTEHSAEKAARQVSRLLLGLHTGDGDR